jgi:uncharacterized membrane protein YkvA (DUF1232 family)
MEDLHACLKLIPESYRKKFNELAELLDDSEAKRLKEEIHAYHKQIIKTAEKNIDIDLSLIEKMVNCLDELLEEYVDMKAFEKQLIIGAVKYFIESDDAHNDLEDTFGFDDDLAVLNAVLITLNKPALVR